MGLRIATLTLACSLGVAAMEQPDSEQRGKWESDIRSHRRGILTIQTVPGARVVATQLRHDFPFGTALSSSAFNGSGIQPDDRRRYLDVARTHFTAAVPENCLKWYHTERDVPAEPTYADADAMLQWCEDNEIRMRGHTVFWAVPKYHRPWVNACSPQELKGHMERRCREIVSRYRGRIDEFDVNNEMLHGRFFRDRCGEEIVPAMFQWASEANPHARLYVNDYGILSGGDGAKLVEHVRELRAAGVPVAGIGCQAHFGRPQSLDVIQERLKLVAELGLPITVTEFDVRDGTPEEKAAFLDGFYRLCFAHPQVVGILMWGFWEGRHWIPSAALWKQDWTPTPMAAAYEALVLKEWWTEFEGRADANGACRVPAFFGSHRIETEGRTLDVRFPRSAGPEMEVHVARGTWGGAEALSRGPTALLRGVWELALTAGDIAELHPFTAPLRVTFTRPDRSVVSVAGFADVGGQLKARAYCDALGVWTWRLVSHVAERDQKTGTFEVLPSELPGKLRRHPDDARQFAYDNGEWFLHIGDTGYRCLTDTEPAWQAYIDQAVKMGATKIRTWFCRSRGNVEALFDAERSRLALPYWQEMDRRLTYALSTHPRLQFQLIPYGEDTAELLRYSQADPASQAIAAGAQARWSAFPNVAWCISNDREIVTPGTDLKQRHLPSNVIDQIGADMAAREPWGTLLTNHQSRFRGYAFTDSPWSDIITLEDLDQVAGGLIAQYRKRASVPVVLDEDRYECYRQPEDPQYFFRRLMWASLLSGGHATYGGLRTYEPYDGDLRGVGGYFDACNGGKLNGGAHGFRHIQTFFRRTGIALAGWLPDDARVGGDPAVAKCCTNGGRALIYLANPTGSTPGTDRQARTVARCAAKLGPGSHGIRWFDPSVGAFVKTELVATEHVELTSPGPGDWVVLAVPATAQ